MLSVFSRVMISRALAVLVFLLSASAVFAEAKIPLITADSALVFDANTGAVILKKNEDAQRQVASTQKLLTALIVAETGDLSQPVTITASDEQAEPTKLNLKPGDSYTRQQLLTALLIKSPNDVARALARDNAGSLTGFADKMNARMARLGGTGSHFVNPNGLPSPEQHSTARDMARVARMVYFNPLLRDIIKTRHYTFQYVGGKTLPITNTNHVLRTYSFCNGMKTGYTDAAKHCLVSSGSYNGKDVIAVVYGDTKARIWNESAELLAYGLGIKPSEMEALKLPPSKADEE